MNNYSIEELSAAKEVIQCTLNDIHNLQVYMPYICNKQLMKIADLHVRFLQQEYSIIIDFFNLQKTKELLSYSAPASFQIKYGVVMQAPQSPNLSAQEIEDSSVAAILCNSLKSSATIKFNASLQCINSALRHIMRQCALNSSEMSFELKQFMNNNGYYQVSTESNFLELLNINLNFVLSKEE